AEDGIRDFHVTGVQTCALPIFPCLPRVPGQWVRRARRVRSPQAWPAPSSRSGVAAPAAYRRTPPTTPPPVRGSPATATRGWAAKIGRASCRERVEAGGGAGRVK